MIAARLTKQDIYIYAQCWRGKMNIARKQHGESFFLFFDNVLSSNQYR
jgi:hypothetical protein